MASVIGVWVCRVDSIIPGENLNASKEEPNCSCIELNFNLATYIHIYCHTGKGQALTPKILAELFPEI